MAGEKHREGNTQEARRGAQEGPGRAARPTSTAPSCCWPRCSRCRPSARRCSARIGDATRRILVLDRHARRRRAARASARCSPRPARPTLLAVAPIALVCAGRRRRGQRRCRSASSPRPRRSSPTPSSSTRSRAPSTSSARTRSFETAKSITKVAVVGGDRRARPAAPSSTSSPRWSACRPPRSCPMLAADGARHRPARRRRLPRHRARRLRLPALAPREAAADGQAGGQGRAQAAGAARRGPGHAAPPRRWSWPARA